MLGCKHDRHDAAQDRRGSHRGQPEGDAGQRALHRSEAECEEHRVLPPPIGVDVVKKAGAERSRQHCRRRAHGSEEGEGQCEIMHSSAKPAVALGYEHARLQAKGFP